MSLAGLFLVVHCGERRVDREQADRLVGDQRRHIEWPPAVAAHFEQAGKAGGALDQVVIGLPLLIFPALAEASAMDIDDARINRLDAFIIQPQPFHPGQPDIVEEHIGMFQQFENDRLVVGILAVERDRFLVAVERGKNRAEIAGRTVPGVAHHVAGKFALAIFDLDHVGAHVGEVESGKRSQHNGRHVDDLQPLQWTRWFRVPFQLWPSAHSKVLKLLGA